MKKIALALVCIVVTSAAAKAGIVAPDPATLGSLGVTGNITFTSNVDGNPNTPQVTAPGTYSSSYTYSNGGQVSAEVVANNNQSADVTLHLAAGPNQGNFGAYNGGVGARAVTTLNYKMYIGSESTTSVLLNVLAQGGASITTSPGYQNPVGGGTTTLVAQFSIFGGPTSFTGQGIQVSSNNPGSIVRIRRRPPD